MAHSGPSDDGRPLRRMTPKLYERALLLYREYPGRHADVAAALSTEEKRCTAGQARHLYVTGLPKFNLPPIADALRSEVRATLGGPGYDLKTGEPASTSVAPSERDEAASRAASVCLNAVSPGERRKLRREALARRAAESEKAAELEVRKLEAEARRAEAQAERARQEAEAERAKAERIRAEASVGARAAANGVANVAELSLIERRAQEAQIVGGIRDQVKVASAIMKAMLFTLANKGQEVVTALKEQEMTPEEYTVMTRRVVSTMKDAAEVGEKTVRLERLIFGEPTERIQVETVGGEDPIAAILSGIEAVQRAAERGVIEVGAEEGERLAALTRGREGA